MWLEKSTVMDLLILFNWHRVIESPVSLLSRFLSVSILGVTRDIQKLRSLPGLPVFEWTDNAMDLLLNNCNATPPNDECSIMDCSSFGLSTSNCPTWFSHSIWMIFSSVGRTKISFTFRGICQRQSFYHSLIMARLKSEWMKWRALCNHSKWMAWQAS